MNDETLKKEPQEEVLKDEFIYLELDRRRELKFGMKGLRLLEQEYKKPMIKLFDYIVERIQTQEILTDDIFKLVHAGLIRDDPELTLEKTEEILDQSDYHLGKLDVLLLTIFQSIAVSTPEVKDQIRKKAQSVTLTTVGRRKSKPGTGKTSSKQRSESSDGQKSTSGEPLPESTTEQSKDMR